MFKFLLIPALIVVTLTTSGCGINISEPFVQCTVFAIESPADFGRGSVNQCLNYELACVKPLVISEKYSSPDAEPKFYCVLPDNYGKTSTGM